MSHTMVLMFCIFCYSFLFLGILFFLDHLTRPRLVQHSNPTQISGWRPKQGIGYLECGSPPKETPFSGEQGQVSHMLFIYLS